MSFFSYFLIFKKNLTREFKEFSGRYSDSTHIYSLYFIQQHVFRSSLKLFFFVHSVQLSTNPTRGVQKRKNCCSISNNNNNFCNSFIFKHASVVADSLLHFLSKTHMRNNAFEKSCVDVVSGRRVAFLWRSLCRRKLSILSSKRQMDEYSAVGRIAGFGARQLSTWILSSRRGRSAYIHE